MAFHCKELKNVVYYQKVRAVDERHITA